VGPVDSGPAARHGEDAARGAADGRDLVKFDEPFNIFNQSPDLIFIVLFKEIQIRQRQNQPRTPESAAIFLKNFQASRSHLLDPS
jgi:hypothetical protein